MRKYLAILAVAGLLASCTSTALTIGLVISGIQTACSFVVTSDTAKDLVHKYKTVGEVTDAVCGLVKKSDTATALSAPDKGVDRAIGEVDGITIIGHWVSKP